MADIYETNKNVDPICVRNSSRVEKLSNRGDKRSFPICATSPRFGADPTASRDAQKQTERDDARVLARKIPVLFPTSPSNRADATLSRSRVFFVRRTRVIASYRELGNFPRTIPGQTASRNPTGNSADELRTFKSADLRITGKCFKLRRRRFIVP